MFKYLLALIALLGISLTLFAETVEVKVLAVGNGKVRVDDGPYQSETVLQCEIGSTIQVEIESLENFIGWGGWGKSSDRSIKTSPKVKTINIDKARTITAYFINSIKDNLILNGDFSLVSNLSEEKTDAEITEEANKNATAKKYVPKYLVESFNRLTAGEWYLTNQTWANNKYCRTGLILKKTENGNLVRYSSDSMTVALGGRNKGSVSSEVRSVINVPCAGEYKLSFDHAIGYDASYMKQNAWNVQIYITDCNGVKCFEKVVPYNAPKSGKSSGEIFNYCLIEEINLPSKGIYDLHIKLDKSSITKSSGGYYYAQVAYDNLSFNFVRGRGFSVIVR